MIGYLFPGKPPRWFVIAYAGIVLAYAAFVLWASWHAWGWFIRAHCQ